MSQRPTERQTTFTQQVDDAYQPPPLYGAPAASQVSQTQIPPRGFQNQTAPIHQKNTDAYVYLALSLVLTVLFSFTGPAIIAIFCTIPAYCFSKQAVAAGEQRRLDRKASKMGNALVCLIMSCCVGTLVVFCFVSMLSVFTIMTFNVLQSNKGCDSDR